MNNKISKILAVIFALLMVSTTEVKAESSESLGIETVKVEDDKEEGKLFLPGDTRNLKVYTKIKGDVESLGKVRVRYRVVIDNPEKNNVDITVNDLGYIEDNIVDGKRELVTDYQEYSLEDQELMDVSIKLNDEILNNNKRLNLGVKVTMELEEYETKEIIAMKESEVNFDLGANQDRGTEEFKQTGASIMGLSAATGVLIMYVGSKFIKEDKKN